MRALVVAAAAAVVALVALPGCKKARTEMVIVVQTEGVRVPEDVAQIRVLVADRESGGDVVVYDNTVPLCTPTLTTGCYTLPLSAVLHPGAKQPDDPVRVQIDALSRGGTRVTSSAALFTFSPKQSLRLDFVLYAACIGVIDCAVRDQACGPDAMCVGLTAVRLDGEPDLGPIAPADLSLAPPGDMAMSGGGVRDLSMPTGAPPDMASTDMAIITIPFDMVSTCAFNCDLATMSLDGPIMTSNDGFM
jgi:hypothetical protein